MRRLLLAAGALALGLAARPAHALPCNGSDLLCARGYDQVAYVTTHNAMANIQDGWVFNTNQQYNIARQLSDGVRAFMLDTHYLGGQVTLCHGVGFCGLGNKPLLTQLAEYKSFLDANPREVVTLIFESYVSAADTAAVFEAAGLLDPADPGHDHLYAHPGGAWPTLQQMIDSGERMVVFSDDDAQASYPWHHYLWDSLVFETPFSAQEPSDFTCADNRGSPSNDLFILNHFLTGVFAGEPGLADQVNHNPFFIDRANECRAYQDQLPNFVTVDFYDRGDVLSVVAQLNGLPCADTDGDGYGSPGSPACADPRTDCNDANAAVNPGAAEIPGNGVDDDCNGGTPGGCPPRPAFAASAGAGSSQTASDLALYLAPALVLASRLRRRRARIA